MQKLGFLEGGMKQGNPMRPGGVIRSGPQQHAPGPGGGGLDCLTANHDEDDEVTDTYADEFFPPVGRTKMQEEVSSGRGRGEGVTEGMIARDKRGPAAVVKVSDADSAAAQVVKMPVLRPGTADSDDSVAQKGEVSPRGTPVGEIRGGGATRLEGYDDVDEEDDDDKAKEEGGGKGKGEGGATEGGVDDDELLSEAEIKGAWLTREREAHEAHYAAQRQVSVWLH
jgi:hypothetical protein